MDITAMLTILLGSTWLGQYVLYKVQRRDHLKEKKESERKESEALELGIACHIIKIEANRLIDDGGMTDDEFREINEYLWKPYHALGGNGTCEKLMAEVEKLPIVQKKGA